MNTFDDNDYKDKFQDVEFETVEIDPEIENKIEEIELKEKRRRWSYEYSSKTGGSPLFRSLWSIAKIAIFIFVVLPILFYVLAGTLGFLFLAVPIFLAVIFMMKLFR